MYLFILNHSLVLFVSLLRFLNSGGFIGYAKDVYELVTAEDLKDTDDDQRYYTKLFLEERDKRGIKLDTKTKIFANLNHAICKEWESYGSLSN